MSSFQSGLRNCRLACRGVFLYPVDYPLVRKETINQMISYFNTYQPLILLPLYAGKRGHPPLFSAELIPEILSFKDGIGCHEVIRNHSENVSLLPVDDPGVLQTFNTPEEFENLRKYA
ncbi:MAG: NTP transferase domain-containing protein, partial [Candidatus Omnitrophota bacterium]|jgi:CTP:molybdopterin cytidylyltransferase MocA